MVLMHLLDILTRLEFLKVLQVILQHITVPTAEFTPDVNTSLLIHANGLSGSTEIIDGSITSQDIRSSSGGTAAFIGLSRLY